MIQVQLEICKDEPGKSKSCAEPDEIQEFLKNKFLLIRYN